MDPDLSCWDWFYIFRVLDFDLSEFLRVYVTEPSASWDVYSDTFSGILERYLSFFLSIYPSFDLAISVPGLLKVDYYNLLFSLPLLLCTVNGFVYTD
jgi:hypothetical protein